jgi:hypothetical protein
MVKLSSTLDLAGQYLKALRLTKGADRGVSRSTFEELASDGGAPFADAARSILDQMEESPVSGEHQP